MKKKVLISAVTTAVLAAAVGLTGCTTDTAKPGETGQTTESAVQETTAAAAETKAAETKAPETAAETKAAEAAGAEKESTSAEDSKIAESKAAAEAEAAAAAAIAEKNDAAKEHFKAFLSGQGTVELGKDLVEAAGEQYYGVALGNYTPDELSAELGKLDNAEYEMKYALADMTRDGVYELILRYTDKTAYTSNWNYIIKDNDGALKATYQYNDGYRTESNITKDGRLEIGGSFGAGAHGYDTISFDSDGRPVREYSSCEYFGSFADSVIYDLTGDLAYTGFDLSDSDMELSEFIKDGKVSICVNAYSGDAGVRAEEEKFIKKLQELGAELISPEEMSKLTKTAESKSGNPVFRYFNGNLICEDKEVEPVEFELDLDPEDYRKEYPNAIVFESDSQSNAHVLIVPDAKITKVEVLKLQVGGEHDSGIWFDGEKLAGYDYISPERPLYLGCRFKGDIPGIGISFIDVDGLEKYNAVELSGKDGSPVVLEIDVYRSPKN